MRDRKLYIILISIFVLFFIVMFLLFGLGEVRRGNQDLTLMVGHHTVWRYHNKKWSNLSNNLSYQNLDWKKYHIFSNQEYIGEHLLWYNDRWYAFDDDRNAIDLNGDFLAYSGNYEPTFYSFMEEDIQDYSSVQEVLREASLPEDSEFSTAYHVLMDFDHDGVDEDFYVISNVFLDEYVETTFSIVYMIDQDKLYMIYEDISKNQSFNGCKPFFTSFLDVNQDNTYEFILSCGRYSVSEQIDMLYQYKNNAFKILISSE